ncbi:MAG: Uma2 family endonuclease [Spirochaetota bacterium]
MESKKTESSTPSIEILEQIYPISVELYHKMLEWDTTQELEQTELVEGVIVKKMTKSSEHNFYVDLLYKLLDPIKPSGTIIRSEKTLQFDRSELEPDISIVEGSLWDFFKKHPKHAVLVVEVAKTSLAQDRSKKSIYAAANVEQYWIVDVTSQRVETYSSPENASYQNTQIFSFTDSIPIFGASVCLKKPE